MSPIENFIYKILLFLINSYKHIELQVFRLFTPFIAKKAKKIAESVGIIFHCPDDKEWTPEDTKRVLSSCKYDKLVHLKIKNMDFFPRVANFGSLAFGETFMEGMYESMNGADDYNEASLLSSRALENNLMDLYWHPWNRALEWVETCAFNLQDSGRVWSAAKIHYDLGNDLFEIMLDPLKQYTCGYWKNTNSLDEAQKQKMKLIADKLDLTPGMKVLDIGCGWGTLCKYLAENYGVECVGVTISKEGMKYGKKICAGLPVEIRLCDYRDVNEKFDRIVSIGMFEHVGVKNYREYFEIAHRCLEETGIFLLHTIGRNHANIPRSELFLHRYIFPNGSLPNPIDLTTSTYGLFIIEDWHNFSLDYSKTLEAWRSNFINGWGKIQHKYGKKFKRMWLFYLSLCAGMFHSRRLQIYQLVLTKNGLMREYRAAR